MNLYALAPSRAPYAELQFLLAETDQEAMKHGVFVAAHDMASPGYCSPTAEVFRIATDIAMVGTARAEDIGQAEQWPSFFKIPDWARHVPAMVACQEAEEDSWRV